MPRDLTDTFNGNDNPCGDTAANAGSLACARDDRGWEAAIRNLMNAVIACGGTGGHLFPGLAVAEVLRERGHEVLLFVSEKDVDALALKEHPEIPFEKLPTIGLP